MSEYKVGYISGKNEVSYKEFALPSPKGTEVLVKVGYCAICTLEQRVYSGIIARYPFAGGHEISGVVEAAGDAVSGVKAGDKVALRMLTSCGECYYCRSGHENQCVVSFKASVHEGLNGPGGFSQYMLVDAKNCYKMADDVDMHYAALSEPLSCVVHSINKADIQLADDVVVIGVGIMGAFHIQLAKLRGARVIACEVDEKRIEIAKKMGADVVINSAKEDPVAKVKELTDGRGADVVFCTVASSKLAEQSVALAGKLARVIFYTSFHPDEPIAVSPSKIHSTEMILTGSVNPDRKDFLMATRLISGKILNLEPLISDTLPLDSLNKAMQEAVDPATYRILVGD